MNRPDTLIPSDPLFSLQWHLLNQGNTPGSLAGYDINVVSVWPDYTGSGVLVGVLDDGMDNTHPDLVDNYRLDLAWDVSLDIPGGAVQTDDDEHGVAVSGLVAATANNGIGGVGVAWGSTFTMYRMAFDEDDVLPLLLSSFQKAALRKVADGVEVSVNSWGPGFMLNDRAMSDAFLEAGRYLAQEGRGGLGIASVFAAGNDREAKMNTNYDPTDKSPWHIVVAASSQAGGITSFSTPGASILITAPGSDPDSMVTTDRQGVDGYNKTPGVEGDYVSTFGGTSSAAPVAAGVISLMLQANKGLGYRDIQEILAYSARRATFLDREHDMAFNGARDWNGGALLASHDFGYGHIDAHAAVRLAESWMKLGTAANLVVEQGVVGQSALTVGAGQQATATAGFSLPYRVEQVSVTVDIEADALSKTVVELISPDGMRSVLLNDFFTKADDPYVGIDDTFPLRATFNTVLNWGSNLAGEWTLKVSNTADTGTVRLNDWSIQAYTAGSPQAGVQVFTDEFSRFSDVQPGRTVLDSANGTTLNAAAVTGGVRFDLAGGVSQVAGTDVTLIDGSAFRHLISGDGDDILIGNSASNILMGGRGDNHVDGGQGVDVVRFIGDRSSHEVVSHDNMVSVRSTELSGGGIDSLYNVELLQFADQTVLVDTPENLGPQLFDEQFYLAQNPDVAAAIQAGWLDSAYAHYEAWGAAEGRNANVLFDEQWYLSRNTDVAAAIDQGWLLNGYTHYQLWGWAEGRAPSAWMNTTAYLAENVDVAAANVNPLQHYLVYGLYEGRTINAVDIDLWV